MSLKAGVPRRFGDKYVLDNSALEDSMALEIENEMKKVYKAIKGTNLPEAGEDDRRMLFTAISRGVLKYLNDKAGELVKSVNITHTTETAEGHDLSELKLNIDVQDLNV